MLHFCNRIYLAVLSACNRGGDFASTLSTFTQMHAAGVKADLLHYNLALDAAAKLKSWHRAVELIQQMRAANIVGCV